MRREVAEIMFARKTGLMRIAIIRVLAIIATAFIPCTSCCAQNSTQTTATANVSIEDSRATVLPAYDLASARWFASAELPVDSTAETVLSNATATSPIITLKHPAGTGVMFALISLTDPPQKPAEVVIGDIDGEDETYFNGKLIGSTVGWGVNDYGIPRRYPVDPQLIKKGENVLSIRIRAIGGKSTFGIRREPLTFGFVRNSPLEVVGQPEKPGRGISAISEEEARKAIRDSDDSTTATTGPLYRKRPSFGRFGKFLHDGLPFVSDVSPTRIFSRNAPQFDVSIDSIKAISVAADDKDPGVDGWHKLVRVQATCNKVPVQFTTLSHLLYPGAVITMEKGPVLQMRAKFGRQSGVLQALSDNEILKLFPKIQQTNFSAFLLYEASKKSCPALLVTAGVATNATEAEGFIDFTFSHGESAKSPGKIYVFYPLGLKRVNLESHPAGLLQSIALIQPGADPLETLSKWMRWGLNEPVATDEYFEPFPDASRIRIHQVMRFAAPSGVPVGEPFLIPPPQVVFAKSAYKYPAELPRLQPMNSIGFSGPVFALDAKPDEKSNRGGKKPADSGKSARLQVLTYDLPIPPMEERGLVALPEFDGLKVLLNNWISDLGTTSSANGVDGIYKSRTQAFQSFSYLNDTNRSRLLKNSSEVLPAMLQSSSLFHEYTEPLSGLKAWWTYYIEGPYFDRYDQDWGNGLTLYGLYTWAKYTGNWDLIAQHWSAIEQMFSWFIVTDDWEWMRCSNGLHGHGTGAGDCASVSYVAPLAYTRLAKNVGRTEDYHYGLYLSSRAAVFLLNRFAYNEFGEENGLKEANSMVLGFHEGAGFLVGELDSYPWNVTSNISGNGVQPDNFDLYLKYAPDLLRKYEQVFASAYPNWMDGKYIYPVQTLYRNNSGYITLPHIYLRARLHTDTQDTLIEFIQKAQSNKYLWWLSPPVISEVMNLNNDIYVADWGRCAFGGASLTRDKHHTKVQITLDNKFAPDMVEIHFPRRQYQLTINGGPVPLTDSSFEAERLKVKLRRPGQNVIEITY
jgi:hypothetical protein